MKGSILILVFLGAGYLAAVGQNVISYSFEKSVTDSVLTGIKSYEQLTKKELKDLKLVALIVENRGDIEIHLFEYSGMKLKGFESLVNSTNRKLKVNDNTFIPLIFPSDTHSVQFRSDHIRDLPYTGFCVTIHYEQYKLKSIQTSQLF